MVINLRSELIIVITRDLHTAVNFEPIVVRTTSEKSLIFGKQNKEKSIRTLILVQPLSLAL